MACKYKILPVEIKKKVRKEWQNVPDFLPRHEFMMCVVASPRSGKSCLLMNLLYNKAFNYAERFDRVIFVSPTLEQDLTLEHIVGDEDIIKFAKPEHFNNLDDIMSEIVESQKNKKDESCLLILDDMIGRLRTREIALLAAKYRHYGMSCCLTSQSLKAIDPVIRSCASHWVLFSTHNQKERDNIEDLFAGFPDFMSHYDKATRERYGFLYVDINKQRLYKNFELKLFDKDEPVSSVGDDGGEPVAAPPQMECSVEVGEEDVSQQRKQVKGNGEVRKT
jgi:hypothetical protein